MYGLRLRGRVQGRNHCGGLAVISALNSTWLLHPWVAEVGGVVEILTGKGAGKHGKYATLGPNFINKS